MSIASRLARLVALFFVLLLSGTASAHSQPAQATPTYLLRPAKVWTGDGDGAHAGWAVLVRDGVI